MDPTEEITIEIGDDDNATITVPPAAAVADAPVAAAVITDDPAAGVEALKRQLAQAEEDKRLAQNSAAQEAAGRADAERRATANAEQARRAEIQAGDSQFDSVSNALNASNREMENLQALKATALEAGNYAEEARLAGEIAKAGARIVNLEAGKAAIEAQRKAAAEAPPPVQQPAPTQSPQQQQDAFLASLPARTADWVRSHPQFFTDPAYQRKVMNAAAYAETSLGLNHTSDDYFKFIDGQAITPVAASPMSTAAASVQDRSSPAAPMKPAPVAAAPSRSVPDLGTTPANKRTITLSPQEREMARIMHPKLKPTDPDPEIIYAKNKLALIEEGVIQVRHN